MLMNGTNGNEPGYPENALVPYPVIVAATKEMCIRDSSKYCLIFASADFLCRKTVVRTTFSSSPISASLISKK